MIVASSAATISAVTSDAPGSSLRAVGVVGGQLGHQHPEVALDGGEHGVEVLVPPAAGLGPGQADGACASSTAPMASNRGDVFGSRPP